MIQLRFPEADVLYPLPNVGTGVILYLPGQLSFILDEPRGVLPELLGIVPGTVGLLVVVVVGLHPFAWSVSAEEGDAIRRSWGARIHGRARVHHRARIHYWAVYWWSWSDCRARMHHGVRRHRTVDYGTPAHRCARGHWRIRGHHWILPPTQVLSIRSKSGVDTCNLVIGTWSPWQVNTTAPGFQICGTTSSIHGGYNAYKINGIILACSF